MKYIKEIYRFLKHITSNRHLLFTLIKNDFKKQYLGSYLGLLWAFIQPLVFMIVIWFVFSHGFRAANVNEEVPFFLWLISGMIPWFFISNALTSGTNAITANAFLVKKVAFRVSVLPIVHIGTTFIVHLGLVLFLMFISIYYGFTVSIYWLQLPYFMACTLFLLLGLSWITSAIRVFVKDIGNLISVLLQIGFWMTPIFWNIDIISEKYQWILKLNPAFYIIQGYRDTFINNVWFWEMNELSFYFISITIFLFILGIIIFKRLRPHFGDVL